MSVINRYKFIDTPDPETGKPRHIHTLDGKPLIGNTTALGELAKTLTWWASGLAVEMLGWTNPKFTTKEERLENARPMFQKMDMFHLAQVGGQDDGLKDYLSLLDKAYAAHSVKLDKSADAGTSTHEALENYVKRCISIDGRVHAPSPEELKTKAIEILYLWGMTHVKKFLASEGNGYNEKLWIGGIFDLLYEDMEDKLAILDFKSAKEVYMSHYLQDAACDLEISESGVLDNDGNQILDLKGREISYYGVFPFGMKNPEPQFYHNTFAAKEGFKHVLEIHKLMNEYKKAKKQQ